MSGFGTAISERLHRRSLASRVTLLTTMAVALVVTVFAAVCYFAVRDQVRSAADESLMQRAQIASQSYVDPAGRLLIPNWVIGAGDVRVGVMSNDGRTFSRPDMDNSSAYPELGAPERAVAQGQSQRSLRTISADGTAYRVVAVPLERGAALVIAQSLAPQERVLHKLGILMLLLGIAGIVGAGLAGWAVASGGLRPVRRLTTDVEEIARTEDLTPLEVEGVDEIARLAAAFNGLLVALAASRDRQRQLIADAGHELRTPLTSMRTNIDLLTQADLALDPQQREELLGDVRAQMEELTNLIGDLVALAREEEQQSAVGPVELHVLLDHAVSRVRLRAPSVLFDVRAEPWWVVGEAAGLERAITNLLDNAAKFSPPDSTVHVTLSGGTVTVDDEGPGIADEDLPHVFDRFYRSAESRAMPGSGLGLSIVKQTADRHSGTVSAGRNPEGGARVTLRIPGAPSPVPAGAPA
ncbi:sensor histidine kinase [Nocardioides sp. Kera G14]|uniref:sensor histidine kinase n=1 Tax=Nocardioides sp. Kera G14 TaxID=2884264 RepID=UPI001D11D0AC|nr:HAMP domain-containing sensor histidine kinase [Nocardioides sp. Kera G14]UDY23691.1 HAMP domain-containing histidine kinase [Nocardioides sp. Kera G14]